jgi:hypothetical protein
MNKSQDRREKVRNYGRSVPKVLRLWFCHKKLPEAQEIEGCVVSSIYNERTTWQSHLNVREVVQ